MASVKWWRSQVDFPVPLGPKRKKLVAGAEKKRLNILLPIVPYLEEKWQQR